MITCREAHHLFDAFLDDDLSPAMRAEMHAHRLQCPECSHELALLEACEDVVRTDRKEPTTSAAFTDNVLAALATKQPVRSHNWGRVTIYIGSPLAAAAALAFAVLLLMNASQPKHPERTIVAGAGERLPSKLSNSVQAAMANMTPEQREEFLRTPQAPVKGVLEAVLKPAIDRTDAALNKTRKDANEIMDFIRYGIVPSKVVLPVENAPAAIAPAPKVQIEPVADGTWFDMVEPGVEHPSQPAAAKTQEIVEMM